MGRRTAILNAPDGAETLLGVQFDGVGTLEGDATPHYTLPLASEDVTMEFYGVNDGVGSGNRILWGFSLGQGTGASRWYIMQRSTGIRFGYIRSGGYGYRRDYNFPDDGQPYHFFFSNRASTGFQQYCWRNGVIIAASSSAYVGNGILAFATPWLNWSRTSGATTGYAGKVAYVAAYTGLYTSSTPVAEVYYNEREDLDARRSSQPIVAGIVKPDLFNTANDITDLSVDWTDSNAGLDTSTLGGLTNSDIVTF